MREIRFRAFDTETEEMSYDFLDKNWLRVCMESPYVELMQFTGLQDKNEKPIYEGDVIQYDNERYEVYWSEDWAMFTVKGFQIQALMRYASYGEIIGNIHENPDLTKEG